MGVNVTALRYYSEFTRGDQLILSPPSPVGLVALGDWGGRAAVAVDASSGADGGVAIAAGNGSWTGSAATVNFTSGVDEVGGSMVGASTRPLLSST